MPSSSLPPLVALSLSCLALLLSLALLVHTMAREQEGGGLEEMEARLQDLEEEHDILIEQDMKQEKDEEPALPSFCSLLPDPGPCRGQVPRWYFLSR